MKNSIKLLLCVTFLIGSNTTFSQNWLLAGNAISTTDWLGGTTANTNPLILKTNGTEKMRIVGTGTMVGIGITTPVTALHVNGQSLWLTGGNGGGSGWSGAGKGLRLYYDATNDYSTIFSYDYGNNAYKNINMQASGGNVGIGTTAPIYKLHVNGDIFCTGGVNNGAALHFADGTQSQWSIEYEATAGGLNFWKPFPSTNWGNYKLFIKDDGKVSIGVVNTSQLSGLSALLTVNGKTLIGDPGFLNINTTTSYSLYVQTGILTEKVRVAVANSTSWADYVFAPDYKLLPLEETENFIHTNKHLPGVPSACEVVEKGIDMAEMDATLLKKIEELTLYIIEQDKKIGMLREEIRSFKDIQKK